jgi:hypothetical protein
VNVRRFCTFRGRMAFPFTVRFLTRTPPGLKPGDLRPSTSGALSLRARYRSKIFSKRLQS